MRLIDADALDMYERLKSYYGDAWRDAQEEIDAQPTAEAIPIEWMLNEWDTKEWEDVGYQVMRRIIADWTERK